MSAPESTDSQLLPLTGQALGLVIALLGAESTGKSTLAATLATEISMLTGWHCVAVPEALREWCDMHGRTPRQDEQSAIADLQAQRIEQASRSHDVVLADTTPLMTAVYHHHVFGSTELDLRALQWQDKHCHATLLMGLDLPWQADGIQRDGPQVRVPVDNRIRALLTRGTLPFTVITGQGEQRLAHAMDALTPLLLSRAPRGGGLLTRLSQRQTMQARWKWYCTECDEPACEHQLKQISSGATASR